MNPTHSEDNSPKRKRGGRPKLPEGERRDYPVKVYFDQANYAKLLRRSKRTGRPLSEIVYELAVNGYVKEPLSRETIKWLRALAGMANNLNQLAHLGHIHGPLYIADDNKRLSQEISDLIVKLNEQL